VNVAYQWFFQLQLVRLSLKNGCCCLEALRSNIDAQVQRVASVAGGAVAAVPQGALTDWPGGTTRLL
jgi:hypothetical protein